MSGARRREGRQAGEREEATAAQAAGTRWSRLVLGAGHTSLSLLRFCSSGCIDMRAAHTVNRPTDWVLVGFHRSAGLGAPCSATSLVFSPAFIATRAESERGAASSESERGAALHARAIPKKRSSARDAQRAVETTVLTPGALACCKALSVCVCVLAFVAVSGSLIYIYRVYLL